MIFDDFFASTSVFWRVSKPFPLSFEPETMEDMTCVSGFGELEEYFLPREIGEITGQAKVPFGGSAGPRN